MRRWEDIRDLLRPVVDGIVSALGLDVLITNSALAPVIVTRPTETPHPWQARGSLCERMVREPGEHLAVDRGRDDKCIPCERAGYCGAKRVLLLPIRVRNEVAGVMVLEAWNEAQANLLATQGEALRKLMGGICSLIAAQLSEAVPRNPSPGPWFEALSRLASEGVLAVAADGRVLLANAQAARWLGSTGDRLTGRMLSDYFLDFPLPGVVSSGSGFSERPFSAPGRRGRLFLVSCFPVRGGERLEGAVISLRRAGGQAETSVESGVTFADLKGESPALLALKEKARRVAASDCAVLITGETGTGKGLLARALHGESPRRHGPFVVVSCAAIPETLLESELFGYEEGAFTGARRGGKPGKVELAAGGTLFLDEIGEMPLSLQAKLLHVVEEKRVERLGGRSSLPVEFRVMAATHRDLPRLVEEGKFRADLYYRLNVVTLRVPPLRERKEDVPLLAQEFLASVSRSLGRQFAGFTEEAREALLRYSWPGNVRELQNAVEAAAHLESGPRISLESLPPPVAASLAPLPASGRPAQAGGRSPRRGSGEERPSEAVLLAQVLAKHGSTTEGKRRAAAELGISLATLYRKLKKMEDTGFLARP